MLFYADDYAPLFPKSRAPLRRILPVIYVTEPDFGSLPELHVSGEREAEADWEGHRDPVTAALRRELRRYTYKPGFTMRIDPPPGRPVTPWSAARFGEHMLRVEMRVLDSRGSGRTVPIGSRHPVPYPITDQFGTPEDRAEHFAFWLKHTLMDFEEHEMREWFRRDGDLVDDPHAAGARR